MCDNRIRVQLADVRIYKRKQESKKERKHAFDQESDQEKRKNDNGQEKKKENTLSTKKVRFKKKMITRKKNAN